MDRPSNKQAFSRRRFIEKTLPALLLVGSGLPAWAPLSPRIDDPRRYPIADPRKVSKASARYRDYPNGNQRCAGCVHFSGGTCAIVEGPISANGWCRHFRRKGGRRGSSGTGGGGGGSGGGY